MIDRNVIRNTYDPWAFGDDGIEIMAGKDNVDTIGSVTITNNFLSSSTGWQSLHLERCRQPDGAAVGHDHDRGQYLLRTRSTVSRRS